jgi:hypothetical protein
MALETINAHRRIAVATTTKMLRAFFDTGIISRLILCHMTINARHQTMLFGTHPVMHGIITLMFEKMTMIAAELKANQKKCK